MRRCEWCTFDLLIFTGVNTLFCKAIRFCAVLICVFANSVQAQFKIANNGNAQTLAQSIVGSGIKVNKAQLKSGSRASATFSYTGTNLGITEGILLTTGSATDAGRPGGFLCDASNGNVFTDPDLLTIDKKAQFDVCILEFDFVPVCDTLRIEYVFASEEYPQFIYQTYNDVFGIFITGSNPAGGNYNAHNIATLANGTPVSIDNINGGWPTAANASHPEYYRDNYKTPVNDIAYNGYTRLITSKTGLVPCTTYHLKIAIADGGNGRYDSGVFVKGNSLVCTNTPEVSASTYSNCNNTGTVSVQVTNFTGAASYTWLPGGQSTPTVTNIGPGTYTCLVGLSGLCSNITVTANVPGTSNVAVEKNEFILCEGQTALLKASGASKYQWTPGSGLSSITASNPIATPLTSTSYSVTGTSSTGCTSTAIVKVSVPSHPIKAQFWASAYNTSIDSSAIQFADSSSGAISRYWSFDDGQTSTDIKPVHVFGTGTFWVTLTAVDSNYCSSTVSKKIIVNDIIKDLFNFYTPNAFTPDDDGLNDEFFPKGLSWNENKYELRIFDRWGKEVFISKDITIGWNGKTKDGAAAKEDVYVWTVILTDSFSKQHMFNGCVVLKKNTLK